MIEYICTIIFTLIVFFLGIFAKRILYINEHEASIQDELKTFNDNFTEIENIDKTPNHRLGLGHLYE